MKLKTCDLVKLKLLSLSLCFGYLLKWELRRVLPYLPAREEESVGRTRYSYLFCSSSLATSSSTDFVRDFDREGGLRVSGLLVPTESSLMLPAIMRIKDVYLINRERCHEVDIKGRNDDSGRSSWFSGGKSETPSFQFTCAGSFNLSHALRSTSFHLLTFLVVESAITEINRETVHGWQSSDKVAISPIHLLWRHYFVQRISNTCPQGLLILDKEETLGKSWYCGQNIELYCYVNVWTLDL